MPFLVAMVIAVLSNSIVTAFGLMALFTIVRFWNILRDTLDTCYIQHPPCTQLLIKGLDIPP